MAFITLNDLYDKWKKVADWVTGASATIPRVYIEGNYVGYSTSQKPTEGVAAGSSYLELDTKDVYIFDGSIWVVI